MGRWSRFGTVLLAGAGMMLPAALVQGQVAAAAQTETSSRTAIDSQAMQEQASVAELPDVPGFAERERAADGADASGAADASVAMGGESEASASAPDAGMPRSEVPLGEAPQAASEPVHDSHGRYYDGDEGWKDFPGDFLRDQVAIFTSPVHLGSGHAWLPLLVVAGGTAGFIQMDPHVMPYFQTHQRNLDDINDVFDQWITMGEIGAIPVGVLTAGMVRHDSYMTSTALMAGRAYADTEVLEFFVKLASRRERPTSIPYGGDFNHTFFKAKAVSLDGSSFPSGHAAGAFCVATVISGRYREHKWVPWLMYSFATAVSLSRITTMGHFPSDVFLGSAMGYAVARFQVLRPH